MQITKCAFRDCAATTTRPGGDGWTYYTDVRPLADGCYCPVHTRAVEELLHDGGGFDDDDEAA
jgi:hypothetical protein